MKILGLMPVLGRVTKIPLSKKTKETIIPKLAQWSLKADIPRLGFALGFIGDIVSGLITLWQTAKNETINLAQKEGIVSGEMSKFICNLLLMGSYEFIKIFANRIIRKNNFPNNSINALSQISAMFISFLLNDLIMPFFKSWLSAFIATSKIPNSIIQTWQNKNSSSKNF